MSTAGVRPHPGRARGDRRRAELVAAGVELLAERGWAAMTARGVADRAGAQLGLIHYHFGGFPGLKHAVAAAVMDDAVGPVIDVLARSDRWQDGLADAITAGGDQRHSPAGRLAAELIVAALQDPEVRDLLARALRDARAQIAAILRRQQVPDDQADALATAAAAALDGLLLHSLIDEELDLEAVAGASRRAGTCDRDDHPPAG